MEDKILITGLELYTPLGSDKEETWKNLEKGLSGFSGIESFDINKCITKIGGEIKNLVNKKDKWLRIFTALIENILVNENVTRGDLKNSSLSIGSAFLGIENNYYKNNITRLIKFIEKEYGFFRGISINVNACASGNFALFHGANLIKNKKTKISVCVGIDILSPYLFAGFDSIRSLSKGEPKPFDISRDGMALGEGGGIMVLENIDRAEKRNVRAYCEFSGYGISCDTEGITGMDRSGNGIMKCFERAVKDSEINADRVDLISAHGTGTRLNDTTEAKAISLYFKSKPVIQAFKSYLGHSMGASSIIEGCLLAMTMERNRIIKIRNLTSPDFDLNFVRESIDKKINIGINNSFGFGGINSCAVFKRFE